MFRTVLDSTRMSLPILGCLLAGCGTTKLPEPVLQEICLVHVLDSCVSTAYAGESAAVVLAGENFSPVFEVDLGDNRRPKSLGRFEAWFNDAALEDVAFDARPWRGMQAVRARIPGTLPVERHTVELQTPRGQRALLPAGFLISDPLVASALVLGHNAPVGGNTRLAVTITNLANAPLESVDLSLSQAGAGHCVLPDPPAPFVLGELAFSTVELDLFLDREGEITVSISVSALANGVVRVGSSSPTVVRLVVPAPAVLSAMATVRPKLIQVGERFVLEIAVSNQGGTAASAVQALPPKLTGAGAVAFDSAPATADLPAAARRTFRWGGVAVNSGTLKITAWVSGRESLSGRTLDPLAADPVTLEIE